MPHRGWVFSATSDYDPVMNIVLKILLFGPPILFSIILHEVMHGYVAYLLGDDTAKSKGRLTLNPLKHIDLIGTIILPLFLILTGSKVLFGWAKPVPVNIYKTRNPKQAMGITALAGPMTNLALAVAAILLFRAFNLHNDLERYIVYGQPAGFLTQSLLVLLVINVILAVFNLIPIPPLDGGRVLTWLLPQKQARAFARLEPYGMFIIFALVIFDPFGILSTLLEGALKLFLGFI
jgi:Zn-dependent protease